MKWVSIMTLIVGVVIMILMASLLIATVRLVRQNVGGSIIEPQNYEQIE